MLLESWISQENLLPAEACRIGRLSELSLPLRRLARHGDSVWRAWTDGHRIWYVTAAPSLELSRERKKPVIQFTVYDETGVMTIAAVCVYTPDHGWQRCL